MAINFHKCAFNLVRWAGVNAYYIIHFRFLGDQLFILVCSQFIELHKPRGGGGGGTSILKVSGTCRWTGYEFAIIAIKTGCLNQPNHWHRVSKSAYLATGTDYSVDHRVAFPPTMFMTGPRSRHRRDASVRAGTSNSNDPYFFFNARELIIWRFIFIEFVLL